jgi:hypothetical protein
MRGGFSVGLGCSEPDRVLLPLFVSSRSPIPTRSPSFLARSLHSTDHRFAMICSGRDDRVGES